MTIAIADKARFGRRPGQGADACAPNSPPSSSETHVLESVWLPAGGCEIDHVLINAAGVFTVTVYEERARDIHVDHYAMTVNGLAVPHLRQAKFESEQITRAIGDHVDFDVPVRGCVVPLTGSAPSPAFTTKTALSASTSLPGPMCRVGSLGSPLPSTPTKSERPTRSRDGFRHPRNASDESKILASAGRRYRHGHAMSGTEPSSGAISSVASLSLSVSSSGVASDRALVRAEHRARIGVRTEVVEQVLLRRASRAPRLSEFQEHRVSRAPIQRDELVNVRLVVAVTMQVATGEPLRNRHGDRGRAGARQLGKAPPPPLVINLHLADAGVRQGHGGRRRVLHAERPHDVDGVAGQAARASA